MKKIVTFLAAHPLAALLLLADTYLSLTPQFAGAPNIAVSFADKYVHILMYLALTVALCLDSPHKTPRALLGALAFSIFWGGLMEIAQSFTDYRSADWLDFLADSVGALIGLGVYKIGQKIIQKNAFLHEKLLKNSISQKHNAERFFYSKK